MTTTKANLDNVLSKFAMELTPKLMPRVSPVVAKIQMLAEARRIDMEWALSCLSGVANLLKRYGSVSIEHVNDETIISQ